MVGLTVHDAQSGFILFKDIICNYVQNLKNVFVLSMAFFSPLEDTRGFCEFSGGNNSHPIQEFCLRGL